MSLNQTDIPGEFLFTLCDMIYDYSGCSPNVTGFLNANAVFLSIYSILCLVYLPFPIERIYGYYRTKKIKVLFSVQMGLCMLMIARNMSMIATFTNARFTVGLLQSGTAISVQTSVRQTAIWMFIVEALSCIATQSYSAFIVQGIIQTKFLSEKKGKFVRRLLNGSGGILFLASGVCSILFITNGMNSDFATYVFYRRLKYVAVGSAMMLNGCIILYAKGIISEVLRRTEEREDTDRLKKKLLRMNASFSSVSMAFIILGVDLVLIEVLWEVLLTNSEAQLICLSLLFFLTSFGHSLEAVPFVNSTLKRLLSKNKTDGLAKESFAELMRKESSKAASKPSDQPVSVRIHGAAAVVPITDASMTATVKLKL